MDTNMNQNNNQNSNQYQVPAPAPIQLPTAPPKHGGSGSKTISALIIGMAIVISCCVLAGGLIKYKSGDSRRISATGSASVDFDADLIVWRGYFSTYSTSSSRAYDEIKKQASLVEDYLDEKGLDESEYVLSAVDISESSVNNYDEFGNYINSTIEGYNLSQNVVISSSNIDLVEDISRDISKLLDKGVELTSGTPEYYCTSLDDIKLDLIDKATDNAKMRIDIMAEGSGAKLGKLRSSNLGVFQITARNSGTSYYSYDGYLDTTSRQKTATITVKLEYDIR